MRKPQDERQISESTPKKGRMDSLSSSGDVEWSREWEAPDAGHFFQVHREDGYWRDAAGRPWRPPNNYYHHSVEWRRGSGKVTVKRPGYPVRVFSGISGSPEPYATLIGASWNGFPDFDVGVHDELVRKVLSKLAGVDVNVGANIGEAKSTLRMLARTAMTAAKAIRAIKRGDAKGLSRALGAERFSDLGKTAGDWYLNFDYGWKPLIEDAFKLHKKLNDGLKRPQIISARAAKKTLLTAGEVPRGYYQGKVSGSGELLQFAKVFATPKQEWLDNFGQLGLTNPAGVAWELLPFSFVVDWFVPIGQTLEHASLPFYLTCLGGYGSSFQRQSWSIPEFFEGEWGTEDGMPWVSGSRPISTYSSRGYQRQTFGEFPNPLPAFKSWYSDNHILTAGSLLLQAAGRRR